MKEVTQNLIEVCSEGVIENGKITGDYDFYRYLTLLEGKKICWLLMVIKD